MYWTCGVPITHSCNHASQTFLISVSFHSGTIQVLITHAPLGRSSLGKGRLKAATSLFLANAFLAAAIHTFLSELLRHWKKDFGVSGLTGEVTK